ncbi:hypothetical protein ACQPW3_36090 [Actinosynnema sp. CA-248983]
MGALLEPTAASRPWWVEVRRESFYLRGDDEAQRASLARKDGGLAFPEEDLPRVQAAIRQALTHGSYARWRAEGGITQAGVWSLEGRRDGLIYLNGPLHAYGPDEDWALREVELEYRHTDALLGLLVFLEREAKPVS